MQRAYAVLKCVFAFFCVMTSVITGFAIIKMAFFTDYLEKLKGPAQKIVGAGFLLLFLWLAFILGRFGYRLFMRVKSSGNLQRKTSVSLAEGIIRTIVYGSLGGILTLSFFLKLGKGPASFHDIVTPYIAMTYWMAMAIGGIGGPFLLRAGYRMLNQVKQIVDAQGTKI